MSASPQLLYRQLDANYEPRYGQSKADFISDVDAVGQAIMTSLRLLLGEWWEALESGLPLFQDILVPGAGSQTALPRVTILIVQRILLVPYVLGVSDVSLTFASGPRSLSFYAVVQTQFGSVVVQNVPTPPSRALPNFGGF